MTAPNSDATPMGSATPQPGSPGGHPLLTIHPELALLLPPAPHSQLKAPLLTVRAAVVLILSVFVTAAFSGLAYLSTGDLAGSALIGLPAGGASVVALHKIIGR